MIKRTLQADKLVNLPLVNSEDRKSEEFGTRDPEMNNLERVLTHHVTPITVCWGVTMKASTIKTPAWKFCPMYCYYSKIFCIFLFFFFFCPPSTAELIYIREDMVLQKAWLGGCPLPRTGRNERKDALFVHALAINFCFHETFLGQPSRSYAYNNIGSVLNTTIVFSTLNMLTAQTQVM